MRGVNNRKEITMNPLKQLKRDIEDYLNSARVSYEKKYSFDVEYAVFPKKSYYKNALCNLQMLTKDSDFSVEVIKRPNKDTPILFVSWRRFVYES